MPSLRKHDAKKTLRATMEMMGVPDSTLSIELDRGGLTVRQIESITDTLDLIYRRWSRQGRKVT